MSFDQSFQQWQTLRRHGEAQEAAIGRPKAMKMAGREVVELQKVKAGQEGSKSGAEAATIGASPIVVSPLER